ncbi:hypothetical protein POTOM_014846 [Populus tomentosa]|uniref:TF-B3 domain-containing protein n=1 Tax=Populus tomentosa TaxID=118781 RepID=A0A8X8A0N6_POPTO|nr:hypothetical protein POTOM_014846 [Populus tomentosa]
MVDGQTAIWFQARDPTGKVWNFELSIRPRGYRKPVIRGDWLNYVREKGLTVNDVIVLTKEHDIQNGVTYHVKVEPDLRLTLKTFSSAYEINSVTLRSACTLQSALLTHNSPKANSLISSLTLPYPFSSIMATMIIRKRLTPTDIYLVQCNVDYGVDFLEFFFSLR